MEPFAHVEISIVEKALALAFSEVVSPQAMVLVVAPLLLIRTEVHPLTISLVVSYMAFVPISVVVMQHCGFLLK